MGVIWSVFLLTATAVAGLALVGLRWRGANSRVFHLVGGNLLILAVVTAFYPFLLGRLNPGAWAVSYVILVVLLTGLMVLSAVLRARRLR